MKTTKITEEMFNLPNAGEVILNLVRKGALIEPKSQLKIFDLENWKEILVLYVNRHQWISEHT